MYIKKILNPQCHGYETIVEADLVVTDGQYDLFCYYYDVNNNIKEGMNIELISAIVNSKIEYSKFKEFTIVKGSNNYYGYELLRGEYFDKKNQLVRIGNIVIELEDDISNNIVEGGFIEFKADRLDCII